MLKNKIFIFIAAFLCIFAFFNCFAYATEVADTSDSFSFVGSDNNTYTVPVVPEGDFSHYFIVLNHSSSEINLYTFTGSLSVTKYSSNSGLTFTFDNSNSYNRYVLDDGIWVKKGSSGSYSYGKAIVLTSCSDLLSSIGKMNAISSAEEGSTESSFFYNSLTVVPAGTLAPIYQKIPLKGVLQEIVMILPVVLMTIVGLIGLRKALSFLSKVLHRS